MTVIPRLHLISARSICALNCLPDVAEASVRGGVDVVHLREPDLCIEEATRVARELRSRLDGTGARLFINRQIQLASEIGADGVHLAEFQLDQVQEARNELSEKALIGISVHVVETALQAEWSGVDYVIAGHVFETGSKPGRAGRGLEFIEQVSGAVSIPVIGIGGITPDNTRDVCYAGAHGIAVMSGILAADDPEHASAAYRQALERSEDS